MVKNIIFDIGNVLLNYKPEEYLKLKIIESDKIIEVHREMFESKEWLMLDRGIITEEEAKDIIINRSNKNGHLIKLAFENWYELFTPIEESVNILNELKNADYKVYFLSNFHLSAFENVIKRYDFFKIFDGGVVSYKEKQLKPEEGLYNRLLEKYQIKPEESIFIDDTKANIKITKKLNFNTIPFENSKDLKEKLRDYKINL